VIACGISACGDAGRAGPPAAEAAPAEPGAVAASGSGMVVTGAAPATTVGVRVLEEGGNAVDAAVAAAFALAVVEPTMSGIGGRTQLLLRTADGRFVAIDGTTEVPVAYRGGPSEDDDAFGYETIAVPGTVAALEMALREHGTWTLARAMAPAIALAEDGFVLPAPEAARIAARATQLARYESSRTFFLKPDGATYAAGETFRQPALAATMRAISEGGSEVFYRGALAREMAADLEAHGAFVRASDFAAYQAEKSPVVRGRYRDHEIVGSYLPASGATTIEVLQILDRFDLAALYGTPEWIRTVAEALLAGFEDREHVLEPAGAKAAWLVSPELAEQRAAAIRGGRGEAGSRACPHGACSSAIAFEPSNTTHMSVADRDGAVVALTQSVGPNMGSRVAATGLGFLYAATMGYLGELEPGTRRHWSSQSPLIVVRDGRPVFVAGGAGGRRIIPGIVETLVRAIDQRMPLEAALAAPRLHAAPGRIDLEARADAHWTVADSSALSSMGYTVRMRDDGPWFARVNAIAIDPATGRYVGVADPRWPGVAAAPSR
jgi:gamma-glutamyltranspeptidase/glutathione hydrolase